MLRRISRDWTGALRPLMKTWAAMTAIQIRPKVTWMPWVPTKVKKAERKALREGPLPLVIMMRNSLASMTMNPKPSRNVTASHARTLSRLPSCMASMARPQVALLNNRSMVSPKV